MAIYEYAGGPRVWGGGFRLDNRQRSPDDFGRCFPHSRDMRWRSPQCKKRLAPKRKCKFNEDWKIDVAWIAKLPDCGVAKCNLCVTDLSLILSSGGRTDVRRHHESVRHGQNEVDGYRLTHVCWYSVFPWLHK